TRQQRLTLVDDPQPDTPRQYGVSDRVGAGRERGANVQQERVVDAGVRVVTQVETALVGANRLLEISLFIGQLPKPLVHGAPQTQCLRILRGVRFQLLKNPVRFEQSVIRRRQPS